MLLQALPMESKERHVASQASLGVSECRKMMENKKGSKMQSGAEPTSADTEEQHIKEPPAPNLAGQRDFAAL